MPKHSEKTKKSHGKYFVCDYPVKDTGRRTKGTTACCSPQNNLSIR
jgi:hypothetical protein